MWAYLLLTFCTTVRAINTSPPQILSVQQWPGQTHLKGETIIAPIQLLNLENICHQLVTNFDITNLTLNALLSSRLLTNNKDNLGFMRKVSFTILNIEKSYTELVDLLDAGLLCPDTIFYNVSSHYFDIKKTFTKVWTEIEKLKPFRKNHVVSSAYINARPLANIPPPGAQVFFGAAIGLVASGLVGGLVGSLFGNDQAADTKALNEKLRRNNKDIQFTNTKVF